MRMERGRGERVPEKQSIREAIDVLFARKRDMRHLNLGPARPMNVE